MGAAMRFDVLQVLSLAGDPLYANDDRAGAGDALAWVIDGATDLGEPGLVGTRGGAAWIAQEANAAFAAAGDANIEAVCKGMFARVARRFEAVRTREPLGRWELPSASFLVARAADRRIDFAWAGDCTALVRRGDAIDRVGPPRAGRDAETAHAASLAEHGLGTKERPQPVLASLRQARERPGRRVLGVDLAGAAALSNGTVPCGYGDEVLLMTDGFTALIDTYAVMDEAALMAAVARDGLNALATHLRAIEEEDAACTRYPRFKRSDDATAIWVRCGA